jgi:hypothetical protein
MARTMQIARKSNDARRVSRYDLRPRSISLRMVRGFHVMKVSSIRLGRRNHDQSLIKEP